MSPILAHISTPVIFGPPYFCTGALYWKTKTNLSRTDDRSTTIPNLGLVGPPNSQNTWHNGYPKGQKWKISYISSIPAAHAKYSATSDIPHVGAVVAVKRLPCHISQFAPYNSQGVSQKGKSGKFLILRSSSPRQIQRHQCYTTCWGRSCCKKATVPYLPIRPPKFTGGHPKGKSGKFLIYPPFQRPTPSTLPPMY